MWEHDVEANQYRGRPHKEGRRTLFLSQFGNFLLKGSLLLPEDSLFRGERIVSLDLVPSLGGRGLLLAALLNLACAIKKLIVIITLVVFLDQCEI